MAARFFEEFAQAARRMTRRPRLPAIAILVLSLGIGMSTALFSVMYGVLLKALPLQQQDRLVVAWKGDAKDVTRVGELSYLEFRDWQQRTKSFGLMAAMPTTVYGYGVTLTGFGEPIQLERAPVTEDFFSLLGVSPELGRTFAPSDDRPGAEPTAVLHHSLWVNRFHSDPALIGKTINLNGKGYAVIGVMPSSFDFPAGAELWTPLDLNASTLQNYDAVFLQVVGRLKPGVSAEQLHDDLSSVIDHLAREHPQPVESGEKQFPVITPLADYIFGSAKPAIILLWAASLLLLVIACINIISLLLAQAITREKEVAVRLALGATRGHLLRQFIVEGLVLSFAGALAGCAVAQFLLRAILALAPEGIPRLASVQLNGYSLLFACGNCVLIALAFGVAPALLMNRRDLQNSLNLGNARLAGNPSGAFFRKGLIVAEISVTAVLLISAGMVIHNFYNMQRVGLGFLPDHALTAQIRLAGLDQPHSKAFFIDLLDRIRAHSEVSAAGAILLRPFEGTVGWDVAYQTRGQDSGGAARNPISNFEVITPDYFRAVGTPVLAGRSFTLEDRDSSQKVMIVSQSLARDLFANSANAVGKQIKLGRARPDENTEWWTVVGVVADAQYRKLGITQRDIFIPFLQTNTPLRYVVVRTKTDPESFLPVLREELAALDKRQAVSKVRTLEQLIADTKTGPRFAMLLFSVFGVFAALLAAVGVYGLVSDSIVQRRREVGIRMALGAQPREVLLLLMQGEMRAVLLGEFFGLLLSFSVFRVYSHLLYGLPGIDFLSAAVTILILSTVTIVASTLPALRATRLPIAYLLAD